MHTCVSIGRLPILMACPWQYNSPGIPRHTRRYRSIKMKLRQRTLNRIISLTLSMLMLVVAPLSITAATPSLKGAKAIHATNMVVSPVAGGVTVPITGTADKGGKFTGNFQIQQFSVVNNQIVAVGTLTGTISNGVGNVIGTVLKTINLI